MGRLKKIALIPIVFLFVVFVLFYPWQKAEPIRYVERASGELKTEKVPGAYWLNWLYYHPFGQLGLESMVKKKFLSDWYGRQMEKPSSAKRIAPFVEEYNINMDDFVDQDYMNFNAFFYRKLKPDKRLVDKDPTSLISPADGKILVYQNIRKHDFIVKGYRFDLQSFLQNDSLSEVFNGAAFFIIRLCPSDYHRYHFPTSGQVIYKKDIDGYYYSVSPFALRQKIELLTMNKRKYSVIRTKAFGDIIYAEVAATMVGSMMDTYTNHFIKKGQEKGYFKFGGSTIVLICHTDSVQIDTDLLHNTSMQLETEVRMGERLAATIK
jgi:phosphatidylserine decarboxylase